MEIENTISSTSPIDSYYISGLTSVLYDNDFELIHESLTNILDIIDSAWSEISDCLPQIVHLSEDISFPYRSLAAYIASKCLFNLNQYKESFKYALDAGDYFDYKQKNDYTETMIITCLDIYMEYIKTRNEQTESLDPRIQEIVTYIFITSTDKKEYISIIGTAIECRDLNICKNILLSRKDLSLLFFIETQIMDLDTTYEEKHRLLDTLAPFYKEIDTYGYYYGLFIYKYMSDEELNNHIFSLLSVPLPASGSTNNHIPLLIAYQLGADFFLLNNYLKNRSLLTFLNNKLEEINDTTSFVSHGIKSFISLILGETTMNQYTDFLFYNNKYDNIYVNKLFNNIKSNVNIQAIAILTLSLMNLGTTNNQVVLNLSSKWLQNIKEWSSLLVVQSFVQIFKYQTGRYDKIYQRYLEGTPEKQGGALAGLSMVYMNKYNQIPENIKSMAIRNLSSDNEYIGSGAALLFGSMSLNNMSSYHSDTMEVDTDTDDYRGYQQLIKNIQGNAPILGLYNGLALGFYMYNKLQYYMNDIFTKIYATMEETKHENITIGTGIGLALSFCQTTTAALPLIQKLLASRKEFCRYAAIYVYGTAFLGTGNADAIKQVLHIMVSDRSADVLRACPIALYLILYRQKKQLFDIMLPLLDSYSSSIRHSAILVLGYIFAEGDTSVCDKDTVKSIVDKLFTLLDKKDDVVNQAVFIALGFIFMGKNQHNIDRIAEYKERVVNILYKGAGNESSFVVLSCIGATLGAGIIDAGGRNVTYSLYGTSESFDITKVFSFVLYQQFWHWHCLLGYCINLFTPSGVFAVDSTLCIPRDYSLLNDTPLSQFDYYPPETNEKENEQGKYETNKLTFSKKKYVPTVAKVEEVAVEEKKVEEQEEDHYTLKCGSRVLPMQFSHIHIPEQRFIPVLQYCYPALYTFNTNLTILYDTQPEDMVSILSQPQTRSEQQPSEGKTMYMKIGKDESGPEPSTPPSFVYKLPSSKNNTNTKYSSGYDLNNKQNFL